MRVFVNTSLGLPYEVSAGEKLDWERLRDRGAKSNYSQGTVPNGGLILTAGVDVQGDRLEVVIMAWGKGEQAYVILYEQILGNPLEPQVWEQVAYVTGKTYTRDDGAELKIRATFVDSGWQTQEVYHRVKQYKYLHWFAIKGTPGDKPLYSKPSVQETNYRGQKAKRGINLYKIGVDVAKETLYARSQLETPGANYLNFPNDLDKSFYKGFCSEVLITKHKSRHPYHVWEVLPGVRNEPLDLCVYALAAAHMVGVSRMNLSNFEAQILENLRDKQDSNQEMSVKSQSNDLTQSDRIVDDDQSLTKKTPVKSQYHNGITSKVQKRVRTGRRLRR